MCLNVIVFQNSLQCTPVQVQHKISIFRACIQVGPIIRVLQAFGSRYLIAGTEIPDSVTYTITVRPVEEHDNDADECYKNPLSAVCNIQNFVRWKSQQTHGKFAYLTCFE
jgi:hypothetical protein